MRSSFSKILIILLSFFYLLFTIYLFFFNTGFKELLFFAILTFLFYIPLNPIFQYNVNITKEQTKYIIKVIFILIILGYIIFFTNLISSKTLTSIFLYFKHMIPHIGIFDFFIETYKNIYNYFLNRTLIEKIIFIIIGIISIISGVLFLTIYFIFILLFLLFLPLIIKAIFISIVAFIAIGTYLGIIFYIWYLLLKISNSGLNSTLYYLNQTYKKSFTVKKILLAFSFIFTAIYLMILFLINITFSY